MHLYYKSIDILLKSNIKNKNLYLYPGGNYTRQIVNTIKQMDLDIDFNIVDKVNKDIEGYSTVSIEALVRDSNSIVFITSKLYEEEIRSELVEKNYRGEIVSFFPDFIKGQCDKDLLYMERMDLVLTSKCTLRCEKCANLMQYYEHPVDLDVDIVIESMTNLLKVVDIINTVYVLGGEPFIYKKLAQIVGFLIEQDNINQIVVITNGTLCPENEELWKVLSNKKTSIHISDYGELSRKKTDILKKCLEYRIDVEVEENKYFFDTGNMNRRNRTTEILQKVFSDCNTQCRSLFNGELHYCPRSSHGVDLGLVEKRNCDYVELINISDYEELKKSIESFLNRTEYIEACDYCDIRQPGYYEKKYPAAEQAAKVLKVIC